MAGAGDDASDGEIDDRHTTTRGTGLSTLFAVVGITLAVVILVLLDRPESSAYYASRDRR